MKKIIFHILFVGVIMFPSLGTAATHAETCARLFPNENCDTWSSDTILADAKVCACAKCSPSYPNLNGTAKKVDGYEIYATCACLSCSCTTNPKQGYTSGTCSCASGVADYSACTTGSSGGTGGVTSPKAAACSTSSNPCTTGSVTISGVYYCRTETPCNANNKTGWTLSNLCKDGIGFLGSSSDGTTIKTTCYTSWSCGTGYTGTATGSGNAGCVACTGKPNYASYTTAGTCKWSCNSGYYSTGTACYTCPKSTLIGLWTDSARTQAAALSTSGSSATNTIADCYLPAGTYYDYSGTLSVTSDCAYSSSASSTHRCAMYHACRSVSGSGYTLVDDVYQNTSDGAGCWCVLPNLGKSFYTNPYGPTVNYDSSSCEQHCPSQCASIFGSANYKLKEKAGC